MALPTKSEDSYILDSDDEIQRLEKQHEIFYDAMGKLVLAPINLTRHPLHILDSATANGRWMRDLIASLPSEPKHTFVGTDIMASYFPSDPPPNTSFAIQDINQPWPEKWHGLFDLVHQRLALVGSGKASPKAIAGLATLVKPGGYMQLVEADFVRQPNDGPGMRGLLDLLETLFKAVGHELDFSRQMSTWLTAAGFVDVQERLVDVFMGASSANPTLREQGALCSAIGARSLIMAAKTFPHLPPTLSLDTIDEIPALLCTELREKGANLPIRVVWGRKPE